jgi:hypothetical protein
MNELIIFIDTTAKCLHLQKLTCKGQVFIRVLRLEIHSVMVVFSTQLCEPLKGGGGYRVLVLRQINPVAKSLYRSVF